MKIFLFQLFLMTFCVANPIFGAAQTSIENIKNGQYGTPQTRTTELDAAMQKGLQLTTEQMPKVHDINLHFAIRTEHEVAKVKISNWSKYWKIKAIQADKDKALKAVLTAQQFQKYTKKRDEMMWEGMKAILF
jgi:hypothetical protein